MTISVLVHHDPIQVTNVGQGHGSQDEKCSFSSCVCTLRRDAFLVVWRVLYAQ